MSEGVDLRDFRAPFVEETEELLQNAGNQALALETALREGTSQARALRELFRAAHTIKGLASMVNVEPIVALAHAMEEVLRGADQRSETLPAVTIEAILACLGEISQRVKSVAQAQPVAEPSAQVLAALEAPRAPVAAADLVGMEAVLTLEQTLAARLSFSERQQLVSSVREGKRALRIDFAPSAELAAQGHSVTTLRERIGNVAEIVKVVPLSDTAAPSGIAFVLLLTSAKSNEEILAAALAPLGVPQEIVTQRASTAPVAEERLEQDAVRVDVSRLDVALDRLSDLVITRFRLLAATRALHDRGVDVRELMDVVTENARQLRALRAAVLDVRMVPLDELFARMRLVVRGIVRGTQKRVLLDVDAAGVEVDKTVAEQVFPAMLHIARNAVDHGIEAMQERTRAGKPAEGTLSIKCRRVSSTQLEITIEDDGKGIDAAAVCARAGVPPTTSHKALLEVLCMPGFSTRDEASAASGRGMGMDIVARAITHRLRGTVELWTQLGHGTRVTLRVPLTIAILDAFVFRCGAQRFVVPNGSIEEAIDIDRISHPRGDAFGIIEHRGATVPFFELAELLRLPYANASRQAFLVRSEGKLVALGVEKIVTQQEVVVRPMDDALVRSPVISGATDLGDGAPTLVLDLVKLSDVKGAAA